MILRKAYISALDTTTLPFHLYHEYYLQLATQTPSIMPSGSCFCKALQYEFSGEPLTKAVCHCLTCRKFSSGSSVNLLVPKDHFRLVKGTAKQHHETHESGMHLTLNFCGSCGCLLYKTADRKEFEGGVIVLAGTLDDPRAFDDAKPEAEFFVKHRASWWPALADAKQLQEFD